MKRFWLTPVIVTIVALTGLAMHDYFSTDAHVPASASTSLTALTPRAAPNGLLPAGFVAVLPANEFEFTAETAGDRTTWRPTAQRLTQPLLDELDRKAHQQAAYVEKAGVTLSATDPFLSEAEYALKQYVPASNSANHETRRAMLKLPCTCGAAHKLHQSMGAFASIGANVIATADNGHEARRIVLKLPT